MSPTMLIGLVCGLLAFYLICFVILQWVLAPRIQSEILQILRACPGGGMDEQFMIETSRSQGGMLWGSALHRHLRWLMEDGLIECLNPESRPRDRQYRLKQATPSSGDESSIGSP